MSAARASSIRPSDWRLSPWLHWLPRRRGRLDSPLVRGNRRLQPALIAQHVAQPRMDGGERRIELKRVAVGRDRFLMPLLLVKDQPFHAMRQRQAGRETERRFASLARLGQPAERHERIGATGIGGGEPGCSPTASA